MKMLLASNNRPAINGTAPQPPPGNPNAVKRISEEEIRQLPNRALQDFARRATHPRPLRKPWRHRLRVPLRHRAGDGGRAFKGGQGGAQGSPVLTIRVCFKTLASRVISDCKKI
ncbi:MAG: hypothetical protein EOO70_01235 [Myxococcaceae bacterium]|nr:MAG: hypothetical protein EOO70_01235 [Myxococcaceae bacterium]